MPGTDTKSLSDILNAAAAAASSTSTSGSINAVDIKTPTEEDLVRLGAQANLVASLIRTQNNWTSRRTENFGQVFVTFELDPESPVEGMTVAEIVSETVNQHKMFGANIFIPAPDARGILRDVRIISFKEDAMTLTASDDAAQPFKPSSATTKITRVAKTPVTSTPAVNKADVFKRQ